MYVLFDHDTPFLLAHGGFQTQIEQTRHSLQRVGVDVDWLRWWDDKQQGQIIHYFGRPTAAYIDFAHQKKMKVIVAELLTGLGSRSATQRGLQKILMRSAKALLPSNLLARLAWSVYQSADAFVALAAWEAQLMKEFFGAPADRVHCIANGVEEVFLRSEPATRGPWLVCTATLTARKRVVELAQAAVAAATPLWVIGVPYSSTDSYGQEFLVLAQQHPKIIRYEGGIRDRKVLSQCYRQARGFVLLSDRESLSLSALEAAACQCPLLLSDLPWARLHFRDKAQYCPIASRQVTARHLRAFYDQAPQLPLPPRPQSWDQIAEQLCAVYEVVLGLPPRRSMMLS